MAVRHDDLNPEEQARQGALDRSWGAAREALSDPDFRARLEESIDRVNGSDVRPITSEECLAQTEPSTERMVSVSYVTPHESGTWEIARDPDGGIVTRREALRLLGFLGLGFATLLSGCGDDDEDERAGATTTTPPPADATASSVVRADPVQEFDVPRGSFPHDVAVAGDGTVWYTAQAAGKLGRLDPRTGRVTEVVLGDRARPHGVIIGPDDAPWITDGGLNALVRVDPATSAVRRFDLPSSAPDAGVHTAAFDAKGRLWFTGNAGYHGRLDPEGGPMEVFEAPGGAGPYGITITPAGDVYYASLTASHLARVDPDTGKARILQPPTPKQGTRRVWTDSKGKIWCSQWDAGQVAVYDPGADKWKEWRLPGDAPQAYAVYVDGRDRVWLSDFGANSLVLFEPTTERFTSFPLPSNPGNVRQIHGRGSEIWGAESAADKLVVVRA